MGSFLIKQNERQKESKTRKWTWKEAVENQQCLKKSTQKNNMKDDEVENLLTIGNAVFRTLENLEKKALRYVQMSLAVVLTILKFIF